MTYAIGIDVGGTFTDIVALDEAGTITTAKSPTIPTDQSEGVLTGLSFLARTLRLELPALLAQTTRIIHGTTVATNALLEGKGAPIALLTTEGHRDVVDMREGLKPNRYDLRMPAPIPLVPRARRHPVRERLRADGSIAIALDQTSLAQALDSIATQNVTSIAISTLRMASAARITAASLLGAST